MAVLRRGRVYYEGGNPALWACAYGPVVTQGTVRVHGFEYPQEGIHIPHLHSQTHHQPPRVKMFYRLGMPI